MRINYQIDGNTNTEKDRAGLRLLPMSEVMIQEVKVVTTGFAPEFGQTMGMVYNAVTPSGTNKFRGEGSYLFRRKPFSAFPFFFGCGSTTPAANCPAITAPDAVRSRIRASTPAPPTSAARSCKNKLFFYGGWEQTRRDLSSTALITVTPVHCRRRSASSRSRRRRRTCRRRSSSSRNADYELNRRTARRSRWMQFHNDAPYNSGGGTDTARARRPTSSTRWTRSPASSISSVRLEQAERVPLPVRASASEFGREQRFGNRPGHQDHRRRRASAAPSAATGQGNAGFDFKQNITAGDRQLHLPARRRTATSSASTGSTSTTSAPRRRSSSTPSRRRRRTRPRRRARTRSATRR